MVNTQQQTDHNNVYDNQKRQACLAVLTKSESHAVKSLWDELNIHPTYTLLKHPEIGMAMVKARTGGNGSAFNMGEMTVTRTVLQLDTQEMGYGYIAGRDKAKSLLVAQIDACLQVSQWTNLIEQRVIVPLSESLKAREQAHQEKVERTKVNFFTMVRGE